MQRNFSKLPLIVNANDRKIMNAIFTIRVYTGIRVGATLFFLPGGLSIRWSLINPLETIRF